MSDPLVIRRERPDPPEVAALRGPFAGHRYNGLSLFRARRLSV